jgi:hypothetical protein
MKPTNLCQLLVLIAVTAIACTTQPVSIGPPLQAADASENEDSGARPGSPDAQAPTDGGPRQTVDAGSPSSDGGSQNACAPGPSPACHPVSFDQQLIDWTDQSSALLKCTIMQLNATTVGIPADTDPTHQQAIARLESAPFGRSSFASEFVGMEVTLDMSNPENACIPTVCNTGYQGYFFANLAIAGQSLEWIVVARVDLGRYPQIEQQVPEIYAVTQEKQLYERMASAKRIAKGTVTATRSLGLTIGSEHDPIWSEAELSIDCDFTGSGGTTNAKVRFAASNDIAWYNSPKLRPGESAILLLQDSAPTSPPAPADPNSFLVVSALDVQSSTNAQKLADLLACPPTL